MKLLKVMMYKLICIIKSLNFECRNLMSYNNTLYNLLTEYKLKKEEEINNLKATYEKNISTERTLKTQVYILSQPFPYVCI